MVRDINFGSKFTTVIDGVTEVTLLTVSTTYKIDYTKEQIIVEGVDPEFRRVDEFTLYGAFEYTGIDEFNGSVDINAPVGTSANFQKLVVACKAKLDTIFADAVISTTDDLSEGATNKYFDASSRADVLANTAARHTHDQDLSIGAAPVFSGANFTDLPGGGDMFKITYDTLNRRLDVYNRTNHTGTQLSGTISDFATAVSANTTVTANTAARHNHSNKGFLDNINQELGQGAAPVLSAANFTNMPDSMLRSIYDPSGINANVYNRSNHTGTQDASSISNFDAEVSNNSDVTANTAARHSHANKNYLDLIDQDVSAGSAPLLSAANFTNFPAGTGDMIATMYDPQEIEGDAFDRANHTGSQVAASISDFDVEVSNNSDVAANTLARHTHANLVQLSLIDQDLSANSAPSFLGTNISSLASINEHSDVDILGAAQHDLLLVDGSGGVTTALNPNKSSIPAGVITLLENSSNWDNEDYSGSAITGTVKGMQHRNGSYLYVAIADNDWIRVKLESGPSSSTGSSLDLSNRSGVMYGFGATPSSEASFNLGSSPVDLGFALIRHNAANAPTFSASFVDLGVANNYQPNQDNIIVAFAASVDQGIYYVNWNGND